jgi:hypothetical protein
MMKNLRTLQKAAGFPLLRSEGRGIKHGTVGIQHIAPKIFKNSKKT